MDVGPARRKRKSCRRRFCCGVRTEVVVLGCILKMVDFVRTGVGVRTRLCFGFSWFVVGFGMKVVLFMTGSVGLRLVVAWCKCVVDAAAGPVALQVVMAHVRTITERRASCVLWRGREDRGIHGRLRSTFLGWVLPRVCHCMRPFPNRREAVGVRSM